MCNHEPNPAKSAHAQLDLVGCVGREGLKHSRLISYIDKYTGDKKAHSHVLICYCSSH